MFSYQSVYPLSPSEAFWGVPIHDVTVKRDSFLPLESPLIRWIHSSHHRRQRALCHLSCGRGQGELAIRQMFDRKEKDKDRTGQGRTVKNDDRRGCFPQL